MPNVQTEPANPAPDLSRSTANPGSGEALFHLARMSGTGSAFGQADYVAISPLAVAALTFGLLGILSLIFTMFLGSAALGLLLGLLAIRRIRKSNGTQSGLVLAGIGVLASVAVGGTVVARTMSTWSRERAYTAQCAQVVSRFGQELKARHFDFVYDNMMTSTFRDRFDKAAFTARVTTFLGYPETGALESYDSTGQPIAFPPMVDTDAAQATTLAAVKFDKFEARQTINLNNLEGEWKIDDIPELFQVAKKKRGPQ